MLKLSLTKFQKGCEILTFGILSSWIYWILFLRDAIPSEVPAYYNLTGVADTFTNRNLLIFTIILAIIIYVSITLTQFIPKMWDLSISLNPASKIYSLQTTMTFTCFFKLVIVCMFLYISYCCINSVSVGIWFAPLCLAITLGAAVCYNWKCRKCS